MPAAAGNGQIGPGSTHGPSYSLRPRSWEIYVAGTCTVYLFVYSWIAIFLLPIFRATGIAPIFGLLNIISLAAIIFILINYRIRRRRVQAKLDETPSASLSENEPFVLYIRPFATGGRLLCRNTLERAGERSILGRVWD